ncbi:LysR family transcriptional regulator [Marinomonas mediterranea]|jgi:Transcriptional regulator|uniref:Transcriptional regulator, LysR family n=1 Tax=Marinomonas mediterranea (strain ATCC 700492 / JCM 21426 / NBRC 103028 / MMB-1) TaxID=717774 RepID=F2K2J6_MARM1|nr:LysR family transcriptional regulator [Marinomonas mediterranea]ADZ90041.1 transcriptional regulator, LysR family [Marinomonas mediterranea MMB-1]WCN16248.1 LysR family transcriptional regulator [Marinomonas mediterranea MMB-1]
MIENVELQWLLSFKAVYEQLSFKVAAQKLQMPTSNVSRHVALLEKTLDLRLLERTTRKMTPTSAGAKLYHGIAPITLALDDLLEEVCLDGESLVGHLKIIMPDLSFLSEVVAEFCLQNPRITLSCDTQLNPTEGLLEGFDLVLRFGRGQLEDSGWVAKEVMRWPSCVVVAPQLNERYPMPQSIDELSKVPCITSLSVLQGMPWHFKNGRTIQVLSNYKVNSGQMAKAAALKGLGFAILPSHACETDISNGALLKVDLDHAPEDLVLYALYSGRKYPLAKVKAFLGHLEQSMKYMLQL